MGIQVDYGPTLGLLEFPDNMSEEQVLAYATANDARLRESLKVRARAPVDRERFRADTTLEAVPGAAGGYEAVGRAMGAQIGNVGSAMDVMRALEPLFPFSPRIGSMAQQAGITDRLKRYSVVDELQRQTPTFEEVQQAYRDDGFLGGARETGAFVAGNVVEQTPNILASMAVGGGLTALGLGPRAAAMLAPFITVSPMETGGAFEEIKERTGRDDAMAALAAAGVGTAAGVLEQVGDVPILKQMLSPVRRGINQAVTKSLMRSAGNVGLKVLGEGGVEVGQELNTALVPEIFGAERDPNLGSRLMEAGAAGIAGSLPFAGAGELAERSRFAAESSKPPVIQPEAPAIDPATFKLASAIQQIDQEMAFAPIQSPQDVARVRAAGAAAKVDALIASMRPPAPEIVQAFPADVGDGVPVITEMETVIPVDPPVEVVAPPPAPLVVEETIPPTGKDSLQVAPAPQLTPEVSEAVDSLAAVDSLRQLFQAQDTVNIEEVDRLTSAAKERYATTLAVSAKAALEGNPDSVAALRVLSGPFSPLPQSEQEGYRKRLERLLAKGADPVVAAAEAALEPAVAPPAVAAPTPTPAPRPKADRTAILAKALRAMQNRVRATPDGKPIDQAMFFEAGRDAGATREEVQQIAETLMRERAASLPPSPPATPTPVILPDDTAMEAATRAATAPGQAAPQSTAPDAGIAERVAAQRIADGDLQRAEETQANRFPAGERAAAPEVFGLSDDLIARLRAARQSDVVIPPPEPPKPAPKPKRKVSSLLAREEKKRVRESTARTKGEKAEEKTVKFMENPAWNLLREDAMTPEENARVAYDMSPREGVTPPPETQNTRMLKFLVELRDFVANQPTAQRWVNDPVRSDQLYDVAASDALTYWMETKDAKKPWTPKFGFARAAVKVKQESANQTRSKDAEAQLAAERATVSIGERTDDNPTSTPDVVAPVKEDQTAEEVAEEEITEGIDPQESKLVDIDKFAAVVRDYLQNRADDIEDADLPLVRGAILYRFLVSKVGEKKAEAMTRGRGSDSARYRFEIANNPRIEDLFWEIDAAAKEAGVRLALAKDVKTAISPEAVASAIVDAFGSVNPRVTIINDPNHTLPDGRSGDNVAGYLDRSTGRIVLNAAFIESGERSLLVLGEEAVHAVWDDPDLQALWAKVKATVTQAEIQAKIDDGYKPAVALEEATVAKVVAYMEAGGDKAGSIAAFLRSLWAKVKAFLGATTELDFAKEEILRKALAGIQEANRGDQSGDAAYMAAVERGDAATAQRMVDEAARGAGYTIGPVFHGTKGKKTGEFPFTVFNTSELGKLSKEAGEKLKGAFFTGNEKYAKGVALYQTGINRDGRAVVGRFYLKNPERVDRGAEGFKEVEYIALSPSQIKSADPITRDDAGNVIPLSRRFDATQSDLRLSRNSGYFISPAQAQRLINAAEARGGDAATMVDIAQVEGELIPRTTVNDMERMSKGNRVQQYAAHIARKVLNIGQLANVSWLSNFPSFTGGARVASDLSVTSRELAAEAVVRAHLAVDATLRALKARLVKAKVELDAARGKIPKAAEAVADARVAEVEGEMLISGLENMLANELIQSRSNASANAGQIQEILTASRSLAEAKRNIGTGIGSALVNIARELPDSLTQEGPILTWIANRLQNKSLPPIMSDTVKDFLTTQLPGRRIVPIQAIKISELMANLRALRDAKQFAESELNKFRTDFAQGKTTKAGKGRRVGVKAVANRYSNLRAEYRDSMEIARRIDKKVARWALVVDGLELAIATVDQAMEAISYQKKLTDAVEISNAMDSSIKLTIGTVGPGGIELTGGLFMVDPVTNEQVVMSMVPTSEARDQMLDKARALMSNIATALADPTTEPLKAARLIRDKQRLEIIMNGWGESLLVELVPESIPGLGGMKIPSIWTLAQRLPWFGKRLAAPNNVISWIGGPLGRSLAQIMGMRDTISRTLEGLRGDRDLSKPSQSKIDLLTLKAMRAHGFDITNPQLQVKWSRHASRIISQNQNPESRPYVVGDFNGLQDMRVLPEDFEAIGAMKQYSAAVFKATQRATEKSVLKNLWRNPIQQEEIISGRAISRASAEYGLKMARTISQDEHDAVPAWLKADNDAAKRSILGQNFETMVLGLVLETNPEFSQRLDPLDWKIFGSVVEMERSGSLPFADLDTFLEWWANERAAETGLTAVEEQAQAWENLVRYVTDSTSSLAKKFQESVTGITDPEQLQIKRTPNAIVSILGANNSFLMPRGMMVAPSSYYRYDLTGAMAQETFKTSLLKAVALYEIDGWMNLRHALKEAMVGWDKKKNDLMLGGMSESKAVRKLQLASRKQALTVTREADYATLRDVVGHADAIIAELKRATEEINATPEDTGPVRTARSILALSGAQLLTSGASMVNNTVGGQIMAGVTINYLNRGSMFLAGVEYTKLILKYGIGRVLMSAGKRIPWFGKWLKSGGPIVDVLAGVMADAFMMRERAVAALTVDIPDFQNRLDLIRQLPGSYGIVDPGRQDQAFAWILNMLQSGFGISKLKTKLPPSFHGMVDAAAAVVPGLLEGTKRLAPGAVDRAANAVTAAMYTDALNRPDFKKRMFQIMDRRKSTVPGWNDPASPNYRIDDDAWEGVLYKTNVKALRDTLSPVDSLEALMVRWYERTGGNPAAALTEPFMTEDEENMSVMEFMKLTNLRTESTTPQVSKGKGWSGFFRGMFTQFGRYGMNLAGYMERVNAKIGGPPDEEMKWLNGLAMAFLFAVSAVIAQIYKGIYRDVIENEPRTVANLSSSIDDPVLAARYMAAAITSFIPYGGQQLQAMVGGTMPANPFDLTQSVPLLGQATQAYKALQTAVQTGDAVYPMVDLMRSAFPLSKPVLNRIMPGDVIRREAVRAVRANAPRDIEMREFTGGGGGRGSPMQPLVRRAVNAYLAGDMATYNSQVRKAQEYQIGLGKTPKAAKRAVDLAIAAKDPVYAAAGRKLPDEDIARIERRLSPRQRNAFLKARKLTSSFGRKRTGGLKRRKKTSRRAISQTKVR